MKKLFFITTLIASVANLPLKADVTEDGQDTGYAIEMTNQTTVPLEGYIYLALANNNKHALTLPAFHTTTLYSGKAAEQLTEGEKALVCLSGELVGAAATGLVKAKTDYELPGGAGSAVCAGANKLLGIFNTCVAGFEFVYKGKKYEYQFPNGCTNNNIMLRSMNFDTELAIYTGSGQRGSWGNVTRLKA